MKIIYKNLSYQIVGILFEVYNELGYGYQEKYYQRVVAESLIAHNIMFKRELRCNLIYKNKKIGKYYLDFLIEDKIILEVKVGTRFNKKHFEQITGYLHATNLKLGILASFTPTQIKFTRILNLN
ncbi:MAG: hypothetical protein AUJ28_03080 [Parcubacteria group bacterium CG1_02_37_51]|nr:MAG: hypothetical protein AUJ28_03080 [Parcubacteria group bacterium CG1_02_37_51]